MNIAVCNQSEIDRLWPVLRAGFSAAIEKCGSDYSAGQLWQMARSGNAFLIVCHDGETILMASIWRFEAKQFRCVMMFGKNMKAWLGQMRDWIGVTAKAEGATELVAEGRNGWRKIFGQAEISGKDMIVRI